MAKTSKGRKYHKEWELTYSWCRKHSDGSEDAFCKLCHVTVQPKLASLLKHQSSNNHQKRVPKNQPTLKPIVSQRTLGISDRTKSAEIELAVAITCHSSILSVDHIGEIIKKTWNKQLTR